MSKLQLCCALLTIAVVNSKRVVFKEVVFKNVTVTAFRLFGPLTVVQVTSVNNLNEVQSCRSLEYIRNIDGPLPILRKNSVTDLLQLRWFEISNSNLEHIEPGAFKNLPDLVVMTITRTALKEVEEGVFNNSSIELLTLSYNEITRVASRAFDSMPNLNLIKLDHNKISQWDSKWFQYTPVLQWLVFSENQILELPDNAFHNFRNNTRIDTITFARGLLKKVGSNLFGEQTKVKNLKLNNNKIETFGDGVLNGVETVENLDLSHNEIGCFSGNLGKIFVAKTTYIGCNSVVNNKVCAKTIKLWKESLEGRGHEILWN